MQDQQLSLRHRLRRGLEVLRAGRSDLFLHGVSRVLGLPPFLTPYPPGIAVEPVNFCNLHCPLCFTGSGRLQRPPASMSLASFRDLVDRAKGRIPFMTLHNDGEPLLHPDLPAMIRYASAAGIVVHVSTNGTLLHRDGLCRDLVQSGLTRLIVCVDGADQVAHASYRRGSDFASIVQGIRLLIAEREAARSDRPVVELQILLMKTNEHQRRELHRLGAELRVDCVTEKTLALNVSPEEEIAQELASTFLPSDPAESRYVVEADGRLRLKGDPSALCRGLYSTTTIHADGTVVPCCYDHGARYPMGNAFEEDLGAIWRGERFKKFRQEVRRNRATLPLCRNCPEGRTTIVRRRDYSER